VYSSCNGSSGCAFGVADFHRWFCIYAFITDAINSYMHLGALHAQGCRFYARQDQDGEEGDLVQLRFPFDELVRNGAT